MTDFPPPPPAAPYGGGPTSSGKAVAALVLGILGLVFAVRSARRDPGDHRGPGRPA